MNAWASILLFKSRSRLTGNVRTSKQRTYNSNDFTGHGGGSLFVWAGGEWCSGMIGMGDGHGCILGKN